jgi:hypothetical protein
LGAVDAETRAYLDDRLSELRRHFGVLTEGMRADVRTVAEGLALTNVSIGRLTAEMNARLTSAQSVQQAAFADVRRQFTDVRREIADVRSDVAHLKARR